MKNIKIAIQVLSLMLFMSFVWYNNDINNSLKMGNAAALSKDFAAEIDLTILDEHQTIAKTAAESKLKAFFDANNPIAFQLIHEGNSPSGMKYVIGTLETKTGNFRVSYYTKVVQQKETIQELSIDNDD